MDRHGKPEIINKKQGSQVHSDEFTPIQKDADININMDGKCRWVENTFIQRLWRSLKYEEAYLKAQESGRGARESINHLTS